MKLMIWIIVSDAHRYRQAINSDHSLLDFLYLLCPLCVCSMKFYVKFIETLKLQNTYCFKTDIIYNNVEWDSAKRYNNS